MVRNPTFALSILLVTFAAITLGSLASLLPSPDAVSLVAPPAPALSIDASDVWT